MSFLAGDDPLKKCRHGFLTISFLLGVLLLPAEIVKAQQLASLDETITFLALPLIEWVD